MRKIVLSIIAVAAVAFTAQTLSAADYYFLQNTASVLNGTWGVWDTTTKNWDFALTTNPTEEWKNSNNATFSYYNDTATPSGPRVNLTESITVSKLTLTSTTVAPQAASTIVFQGTLPGLTLTATEIFVASLTPAISAQINLGPNLTLIGGNADKLTKAGGGVSHLPRHILTIPSRGRYAMKCGKSIWVSIQQMPIPTSSWRELVRQHLYLGV